MAKEDTLFIMWAVASSHCLSLIRLMNQLASFLKWFLNCFQYWTIAQRDLKREKEEHSAGRRDILQVSQLMGWLYWKVGQGGWELGGVQSRPVTSGKCSKDEGRVFLKCGRWQVQVTQGQCLQRKRVVKELDPNNVFICLTLMPLYAWSIVNTDDRTMNPTWILLEKSQGSHLQIF